MFQVSPTGTGRAGTACAGTGFSTSIVNAGFGTVRFTPEPVGAHVTLPGFGSDCVIDFTFDVLKSPTGDQDPSTPGSQTAQAAEHTQFSGALSNYARGTSNGTTVRRAGTPAITTLASGNVALGGRLTDQATVSGLVSPVAGAIRDVPPVSAVGAGVHGHSGVHRHEDRGDRRNDRDGDLRRLHTHRRGRLPLGRDLQRRREQHGRQRRLRRGHRDADGDRPPPPGQGVLGACIPSPGPVPAGGELCKPGSALLSGKTGCQRKAFRVQVRGRQIAKVVFTVDGARLATLRRPNRGKRFSVLLVPRNLKLGRHRVNARITFAAGSGTRARTLRMVVSRCKRAAVAPRFVG